MRRRQTIVGSPECLAPQRARGSRAVLRLYAGLAVLVAAYLGSFVFRPGGQKWPLVDNWGIAGLEMVCGLLCLARIRSAGPRRTIALALGAGLVAWSTGDVLIAVESLHGAAPPTPSPADAFYLLFYPCTYIALSLLLRKGVGRTDASTWLDGAVAGLGAASVTAAFAFHAVVRTAGGSSLSVATNLAYPLGDTLLLALVVAGSATLPGRMRASWILLAVGCAVNGIGDTMNLFQSSFGGTHLGTALNATAWPLAILLMSVSVWITPRHQPPVVAERGPGFVLPGIAALAALAILCIATQQHMTALALDLAVVTLGAAGVRMVLSLRELHTLTNERQRQAVTDELTGLGNRRQLFAFLDAHLTAEGLDPPPLAFLFVDLDHFKEINDAFGHSAGDQLLRQLGPRMRDHLRAGDLLARIGGDELAVVLLGADAARATEIAGRLAASFDAPFDLDVVKVTIGASIGIATAPTDAIDSVGLLRCADIAMYRAKLGHTPFETYNQDIDDAGNRMRLVEELRSAIEGRQLVLHYQAQVDPHHGGIPAVEALLRWPHPRLGNVPPLEFLPLAEEAGLMRPLTALVLDMGLGQCAAWRAEGRDVTMSVNISASNLLDADFTTLVVDLLRHHDLPPSALTLEITETTIIRDFKRSSQVIDNLKALGLEVSVDDFGAGFTSLAYLGSLAVSELKLDKSFIDRLAAAEPGQTTALIRATIELGHALGLRVVAEGVEDQETLNVLARLHCDLIQGYIIGRPVAAEDLFRPMATRPSPTASLRAAHRAAAQTPAPPGTTEPSADALTPVH